MRKTVRDVSGAVFPSIWKRTLRVANPSIEISRRVSETSRVHIAPLDLNLISKIRSPSTIEKALSISDRLFATTSWPLEPCLRLVDPANYRPRGQVLMLFSSLRYLQFFFLHRICRRKVKCESQKKSNKLLTIQVVVETLARLRK